MTPLAAARKKMAHGLDTPSALAIRGGLAKRIVSQSTAWSGDFKPLTTVALATETAEEGIISHLEETRLDRMIGVVDRYSEMASVAV